MNITRNGKREKTRQIKKEKKAKRKTNQHEIKDNCNKIKAKINITKKEKGGKR